MTTNRPKFCPRCGYSRRPDDVAPPGECPRCGVIYAKAGRPQSAPTESPLPSLYSENNTNYWRYALVVGAVLVLAGMVWIGWEMLSASGKRFPYDIRGAWSGWLERRITIQRDEVYRAGLGLDLKINEKYEISHLSFTLKHEPAESVTLYWNGPDEIEWYCEEKEIDGQGLPVGEFKPVLIIERLGKNVSLRYHRGENQISLGTMAVKTESDDHASPLPAVFTYDRPGKAMAAQLKIAVIPEGRFQAAPESLDTTAADPHWAFQCIVPFLGAADTHRPFPKNGYLADVNCPNLAVACADMELNLDLHEVNVSAAVLSEKMGPTSPSEMIVVQEKSRIFINLEEYFRDVSIRFEETGGKTAAVALERFGGRPLVFRLERSAPAESK